VPVAGAGTTYTAQVIVDRQTIGLTGFEGALVGQAIVSLPAPGVGYGFLVEVIDLNSNSTTPSTASVYIGAYLPQNEVDYSVSANHDIADENQPRYVPSGQVLSVLWSGLSAKAFVTARIQYSIIQFVPATLG
jgi:hypothetical protein